MIKYFRKAPYLIILTGLAFIKLFIIASPFRFVYIIVILLTWAFKGAFSFLIYLGMNALAFITYISLSILCFFLIIITFLIPNSF